MKHTLEVDSILLRFGPRIILQDVYLKCETGSITGLLGLNGSGKTCLMRIMMGELRPEHKFIRIDERVITGRRRTPEDIAYMPQHHFIPGFLTVRHVLKDYGASFDEFTTYFPEFATKAKQLVGELSGGELRLLEFFVVIKSKTKFVILDEPFSHVMPVHTATIMELIREESQRKGIVISDHMFRHIIELCGTIYLAENTHVRLIKSPDELVRWGYTSRL